MTIKNFSSHFFTAFLLLSFSLPSYGATLEGKVQVFLQKGKDKILLQDHSGVVIYLIGYKQSPQSPPRPLVLGQKGKQFTSHLLPIVKGETIDFPNYDKVYHNIFSVSKSARFDLGLYDEGKSKSYQFKRIGVANVFCNIHPQMRSTVLVLPNRGFTVTDSKGNFRIEEIPSGKHLVRAWLKGAGKFKTKLNFVADKVHNLQISLTQKKPPEAHLNKYGQPYKKF